MISTIRDYMHYLLQGDEEENGGYYLNNKTVIGETGDFSTSSTFSVSFSEAISNWLKNEIREQQIVNLIECGPGNGDLALHILKNFGWFYRKRLKIKLHLVETNKNLAKLQKEKLSNYGCQWHTDIESALKAFDGEAVIYSNEFVDALPFNQIEWCAQENKWYEVAIDHNNWKDIKEKLIPFQSPVDLSFIQNKKPNDKQRIEVSLDYQAWLKHTVQLLNKGSILTIDYGYEVNSNLKLPRNGTLRAYKNHQIYIAPEIYSIPGQKDITADVNFSDLINWGEQSGLKSISCSSQKNFLEQNLPDFKHRIAREEALQFISNPMGAGTAFLVLHQRKTKLT